MAEAVRDLLNSRGQNDAETLIYITYLTEHSVDSLRSSEPQFLTQRSQSLLLAVQGLSKRSHKPVVNSAASHASLRQALPVLARRAADLRQSVPRLDSQADYFSATFSRAGESHVIARRKETLRLMQNAERLVDLMEVPPLLVTAINSAPLGFTTTLDLYSHVRRLASLYPESSLISSILSESDAAILQLASDLIDTLKAPGLKLAAALRTVGWLKRILPDLVMSAPTENVLPALHLVCRLTTLLTTLNALEPLRQLADEELLRKKKSSQSWSGGQQTERYLKRFIEVFREHSFNIVSVSKNVGASFVSPSTILKNESNDFDGLPIALTTFPLHIVNMLLDTLSVYLPTVRDQASRESIITQVLYCAGSLGRLGADFGMFLAIIGGIEWASLVKRHRLLAGRLDSVIGEHQHL